MENLKTNSESNKWPERTECLVEGPFYLVIRLSRYFGIAPVQFTSKSDGMRISLSPGLRLVTFVIITLLTATMTTGLCFGKNINVPEHSQELSKMGVFYWVSLIITVVLAASVACYGAPDRIAVFIRCMDRMQKVNSSINAKKWTKDKKYYALVFSIVFNLLLLCIDFWGVLKATGMHVLVAVLSFIYFFAKAMIFILMLQFVLCVLEAKNTLKSLNDLLEHILQPWSMKSQVNFGGLLGKYDVENIHRGDPMKTVTKSVHETIRQASMMYGSLCDVVEKYNSSYGLSVVLLFGNCVVYLIYAPFMITGRLSDSDASQVRTVIEVSWCAIHSIWMIVMVEPCHMTRIEMERTSMLVCKLAIKHTDQNISVELDKFSRYLLLNKFTYSPLGICTLTRSLVVTVFASVMTYLLLVFQFRSLDGKQF